MHGGAANGWTLLCIRPASGTGDYAALAALEPSKATHSPYSLTYEAEVIGKITDGQ